VNEVDGVFHDEFVTHLLEATTLRTKAKASDDCEKLAKWRTQFVKSGRHVECWFVTQEEPTADQRFIAEKNKVHALSYTSFRQKLVDSPAYLAKRESYPFGSARDPSSDDYRLTEDYVPRDYIRVDHVESGHIDIAKLATWVDDGLTVVVTADYGSGKSMTLRAVFLSLALLARRSTRPCPFPVHLNLRDHHGQTDPVEALERHARRIGFSNGADLVTAWRAGFVHLFLDGFDEIAGPSWAGSALKLSDVRHRSMELVRTFLKETPRGSGVMIAGRKNYFASQSELRRAIGVGDRSVLLEIGDFTEQQTAAYLARHGWKEGVPGWLPARPLLLGYLAGKGLLREVVKVPAGSVPAMAWDRMLTLLCKREADLEANLDGATLRRIIEKLASRARRGNELLAPLSVREIRETFQELIGMPLDERGEVVLQRLPGLGPTNEDEDTRRFVDEDLVDSAAAGEVSRFAMNPFDPTVAVGRELWATPLGTLGIEVAAFQCAEAKISPAQLSTAIESASTASSRSQLVVDLARVALERGDKVSARPTIVSGVYVPSLVLDNPEASLRFLQVWDSVIMELDIPPDGVADDDLPTFVRCLIASVKGRVSRRDLPPNHFDNCEFADFSGSELTTAALMHLPVPMPVKVALTVLKKLYFQRGSGRKESALHRGLDQQEKQMVAPLLQLMRKHGFAMPAGVGGETVWIPVRGMTRRVGAILDAPTTSRDTLLESARKLPSGL
jgi:hypothetical protein